MRVLLDTNVLISYVLSANAANSAAGAILTAAGADQITLLYVAEVIDEFQRKVRARPDLAARIPEFSASQLIADLADLAVPVRGLTGPYPVIGRDPKDDYLIAHAIVAEADYLVSWDRDLLDLRESGSSARRSCSPCCESRKSTRRRDVVAATNASQSAGGDYRISDRHQRFPGLRQEIGRKP